MSIDSAAEAPVFSIIVPAYNAAAYIEPTIRSVLAQTISSWELIIVDDGSTDDTREIVERFAAMDPRIRLLRQPNLKQAAARNTGIRHATGAWLAFLDADDLWFPNKLAVQLECITDDPSIDVVLSDGFSYFEDRRARSAYHWPVLLGKHCGHALYPSQLLGNSIPNLSVVLKREWTERIGLQDEDPSIAGVEDHDYWLRLMKAGATFFGVDRKLFIYRVHQASVSANGPRQLFITTLVRMKNFDAALVDPATQQRLLTYIRSAERDLYANGEREWARAIGERAEQLGLMSSPRVSVARVDRFARRIARGLREKPKTIVRRVIGRLVERGYFALRSRASRLHRRLNSAYVQRTLRGQLIVKESLHIDETAQIKISHPNGRMMVTSLLVGDCSRINLVSEGSEMIVDQGVLIARFCNITVVGRLLLGRNVLFNNYCSVTCHDEVIIGSDTWFGEGVRIYDHNHRYKAEGIPFVAQGFVNERIEIGANVWVGANCVILKGVSIGEGSVIGANNVIYKSVPPNTLVLSRPMEDLRLIERELFETEP